MSDVLARFRAAFSDSQDNDVALVTGRARRRQGILNGNFPTTYELLSGYPLTGGDITRDMKIWAGTELRKSYVEAKDSVLASQLSAVVENPCRSSMAAVDLDLLASREHDRRDYYMAMLGDEDARWKTVRRLHGPSYQTWLDELMAVGLAFQIARLLPVPDNVEPIVPDLLADGIDEFGIAALQALEVDRYRAVMSSLDASRQGAGNSVLDDVEDVTAGIDVGWTSPSRQQAQNSGVVVVPAFPYAKASSRSDSRNSVHGRKAVSETFSSIAGVSLPLVTRGDLRTHRAALASKSPHLAEIVDILLGDLSASAHARFRATILVGSPGAGKSALARDICSQLGLPMTVYSAGGVSDASFGGTSAQWSTSGASVPLQLVLNTGVANPVVIVDEIDKVATGSHNGSLVDALLSFVDRGNAGAIRDPAIEMTVDLSHVNWILTANDLARVPEPLRDRCRIVRVPNPEWKHVGDLARSITGDIARERNLHEDWIAPFDGDELDLVRKAWSGGSIRKLRRVIEVLIDGREAVMARC